MGKKVIVKESPRSLYAMCGELASTMDSIESIEREMNAEIGKIRDRYYPKMEPLTTSYKELEAEISGHVQENRASLYEGDKKSITVGRVKLSYRTNPSSLELAVEVSDKKKAEEAWNKVLHCAKLRAPGYIVTKDELDKRGLVKAGDKILKMLGLCVRQTESFKVEVID